MGLTGFFTAFFTAQFYIVSGGTQVAYEDMSNVRAGAYVAYAVILLYAGRDYYLRVLGKAFRPVAAGSEEREPILAARVFLLAFIGFVGSMVLLLGLDWLVALVFGLSMMIFFLVFTRIICETGIPILATQFDVGLSIANVMGLPAVGPGPLVMMFYLSNMLNAESRQSLMPYVATSLKTAENVGGNGSRVVVVAYAGMLFALVLCFVSWTYGIYAHGAYKEGSAITAVNDKMTKATNALTELEETGQLEEASAAQGLAKLPLILKNMGHARELAWMTFGAALISIVALLRFNVSWWPLHPVLFLVWGTQPSRVTWFSFLIGWGIKEMVVRFGGGRSYQSLKPVFLGLIMGEFFAVAMVQMTGLVYYLVTHLPPRNPQILP
jgi:hypothetical protein